MAEPNDGPPVDEQAPATQPALTSSEIQALVATEAQRIVDSRIPGLQSAYERQIAQLKKELKQAKADPDGYSSGSSELEAELAQARREAASLRAGRQYPDAYPVYESLMSATDVEEQLDILQGLIRGTPPAPEQSAPPAPPAAPATPPIDPNRPLEAPGGAGAQMTKEIADGILARFGNAWPKF